MDNNSENSDKVFGEKFQKALQAINYLSSLNLPSSSTTDGGMRTASSVSTTTSVVHVAPTTVRRLDCLTEQAIHHHCLVCLHVVQVEVA
jgi:hypothetical protein